MAPDPGSEAEYLRATARKDLLNLLEGVSKETFLGALAKVY